MSLVQLRRRNNNILRHNLGPLSIKRNLDDHVERMAVDDRRGEEPERVVDLGVRVECQVQQGCIFAQGGRGQFMVGNGVVGVEISNSACALGCGAEEGEPDALTLGAGDEADGGFAGDSGDGQLGGFLGYWVNLHDRG